MSQILYQLDDNTLTFPPIDHALTDPNGLLALGGNLSTERLIRAYSQGIFPWYGDNDPLMWWSPNPRAIINIEDLRINRTLRKAINKFPFEITLNRDFTQVIKLCANAPFRDDETWIIDEMQAAYISLHEQNIAHSIEIWQTVDSQCIDTPNNEHQGLDSQSDNSQSDDNQHENNQGDNNKASDKLKKTEVKRELVGGLYGVAINGFFSGESMFYKQANASKFALVALGQLLKSIDVHFIDCQLLNPFLEDMGAIEIKRETFISMQQSAITTKVPEDFWQARTLTLT